MTPLARKQGSWRDQFPTLRQQVNGRPLVYLDTAATSMRPRRVIDAVTRFYEIDNANPGPALHTLARRASHHLEGARKTVGQFIGASDPLEVVFTRGTTEAINLVAQSWGVDILKYGDEILIGIAEHSSNMLPWQYAARRHGALVRYFDISDDGRPRLDDLRAQLTPRTRIVAFSHVSNVLGLVNPVREMCDSIPRTTCITAWLLLVRRNARRSSPPRMPAIPSVSSGSSPSHRPSPPRCGSIPEAPRRARRVRGRRSINSAHPVSQTR
jgi:selenocysteine lyase/cysteine desulfurase